MRDEQPVGYAFIAESNRIENIHRAPTIEELKEYQRFMALKEITLDDMMKFVSVYQPNAMLRNKVGLNVRVGSHLPPAGGPKIKKELEGLLLVCNEHRGIGRWAYDCHHDYETLHPFTDGNGRSGRILWLWMMQKAPLGFLHTWYYQSLDGGRK